MDEALAKAKERIAQEQQQTHRQQALQESEHRKEALEQEVARFEEQEEEEAKKRREEEEERKGLEREEVENSLAMAQEQKKKAEEEEEAAEKRKKKGETTSTSVAEAPSKEKEKDSSSSSSSTTSTTTTPQAPEPHPWPTASTFNKDTDEALISFTTPFKSHTHTPETPLPRALLPAGNKATRPPLSGRPPLHRPWEDIHIQKIVITISSTDRGQRISDKWTGDKLETILAILKSITGLCERGFDVLVWFVSAWEVSLEKERVEEALFCQRTQGPVATKYWDHFPEDVGALLASRHRLAMYEVKDEYDFFVSIEDDIFITPGTIDAYVDASARLALTTSAANMERYLVGFIRKEHDKLTDDKEWAIWETNADEYETMYIPGAGYWAHVFGNTHQAMWMATREQLYNLDDRCIDGFITLKNPDGADWVEYWSGMLQTYDSPAYCDDLWKVLPVSTFRNLTVWHMTDSKLHYNGVGVTPVDTVVEKLEKGRARIEHARQGKEELIVLYNHQLP